MIYKNSRKNSFKSNVLNIFRMEKISYLKYEKARQEDIIHIHLIFPMKTPYMNCQTAVEGFYCSISQSRFF